MTGSSELYTGMEVGDDLSSAMRTETLAGSRIPPDFDSAPSARTESLQIEIFDNRKYLKVERNITLRKDAKPSKIRNYRAESHSVQGLIRQPDVG